MVAIFRKGFFQRDAVGVQSEKTKRKDRESKEHLVPKPVMSNNNEQIDIPPKTRKQIGIQNRTMNVRRTEATKHILNANCYDDALIARV